MGPAVKHMATTSYDSCNELLKAMIAFDTVNSKLSGQPDAEAELARHLGETAKALGFATLRLPVTDGSFNLLILHEVRADAPWLLFESHLDTVSAANMTIPPFGGEIREGRIYGRGACDTKGTGAAMLWALKRYASECEGPNNIAILYSIDEEVGATGIGAFANEQLPQLAWRPIGAIVGEPTELKPVVAHNGSIRLTIETHGVAAHSCDPSRGRSAISMMVKVIEAIESRYIPNLTATHPLTGKAQCSINVIEGGVQSNVIPARCTITIDRRLVPGEDGQTVQPALERILDDLRQEHPELTAVQSKPRIGNPLDPSVTGAFADAVCGVFEELGMPSEPSGEPYGTDGGALSRVGLPTVVVGPGNIAQAHTKDEWLDLAEFNRGVDVYLALMRSALNCS